MKVVHFRLKALVFFSNSHSAFNQKVKAFESSGQLFSCDAITAAEVQLGSLSFEWLRSLIKWLSDAEFAQETSSLQILISLLYFNFNVLTRQFCGCPKYSKASYR